MATDCCEQWVYIAETSYKKLDEKNLQQIFTIFENRSRERSLIGISMVIRSRTSLFMVFPFHT